MPAALLVLLALSPGLRAPDLQVEAQTAAGVALPELAEGVARALVASGARVVLGGPANDPCPRCARVAVTDLGQGRCRIEVTQDSHTSSGTLSLGASSSLLDRARAVAIQARLLVRGEPATRPSEGAGRPLARKGSAKQPAESPAVESPALAVPVETRLAPEPPREPVAISASPAPTMPTTNPAELTSATPAPKPAPTLAAQGPPARRKAEETRVKRPEPEPEPDDAVFIRRADSAQPRWPWIPLTIGLGAAAGAGLCALAAQSRYEALSDKSRPYGQAVSLKHQGENWQTAAFIASGVAVAGLGVGIWGFVSSKPNASSLTPAVAMIPGGAMLAMTGGLP